MVDSDHSGLRKGWLSTRLAPRQVIEAERSEQDSSRLRERVHGRGRRPSSTEAPVPPVSEKTHVPQARQSVDPGRDASQPRQDDRVADDALHGIDAGDVAVDELAVDDTLQVPDSQPDWSDEPAPDQPEPPEPPEAAPSVRAAPSASQRRRQAAQRAARKMEFTAGAGMDTAPAVFGEAMSVVQAEFRPARDLVVVHQPESPRARAYRRLHGQLMARMQHQPETPAVAAVSPKAGEGRSSLAGNLAVLFARAGVRVLLIDADLRKGGQERLFGCRAESGLSDWLRGDEALTGLWFEDLPGLVLVPAGRYDTGAAERLTHPGFRQWIARQGKAEQVVIIDTAAGADAEETQSVCAAAGGALLVCRRNRTSLTEVRRFIDSLEAQRVQFYGAALLD